MFNIKKKEEPKVEIEEVEIEKPKKIYPEEVQRELDLCYEHNLPVQAKIREMEYLGYKFISISEAKQLLDCEEIQYPNIYEFSGKIPYGILLKYEEAKESGLFKRFQIQHPKGDFSNDPLLTAEVEVIIGDGKYDYVLIDFLLGKWE